jgi:hypothetical protein
MRGRINPQFRFLLRASALLIAALLVWYFFLTDPLLSALRLASDATIHMLPGGSGMARIATDGEGNWLLQIPAPAGLGQRRTTQEMFGAERQPVAVRSLRLAVSRDVPVLFALVFPVFWAVVLAAPWSRRSLVVLLVGTALVFVEAWLAIIVYCASKIDQTLHLYSGAAATLLDFAEYLNMYVAPYLAPVLIALAVHRDLRTRILYGEPGPEATQVDAPKTKAAQVLRDSR